MNYFQIRSFVNRIKSSKISSKMSNELNIKEYSDENLIEYIMQMADPDALKADGFDDAIIGLNHEGRIVYNIRKMIDILMEKGEMTHLDALEYLSYNVFSAYVGELMPIYVNLHRTLS